LTDELSLAIDEFQATMDKAERRNLPKPLKLTAQFFRQPNIIRV